MLSVSVSAYADVNGVQCGGLSIKGDEIKIKLAQLYDTGRLYEKMLEVQVIKMDIAASLIVLDLAMGVEGNITALKAAVKDILDETTELSELYSNIVFNIEIQEENKLLIGEEYTETCGEYVATPDDIASACTAYPELSNTINCKVLKNMETML